MVVLTVFIYCLFVSGVAECKALYPYRATEDGDINFDAGDVIVVVEKQDNGWWRGYHGDDHGFFPGSYVQQVIVIVIVKSRFLQRPQKRIRGKQLIQRRLTRIKSIDRGSRSKEPGTSGN